METSLVFVFVLAGLLGYELVSNAPSTARPQLSTATGSVSGFVTAAAIAIAAGSVALMWPTEKSSWGSCKAEPLVGAIVGFVAVFFAAMSAVGSFLLADRSIGTPDTEETEGGSAQ